MVIIMDMSTGKILEDESSRRYREEVPTAGWADGPQALPRLEEAVAAARCEPRADLGAFMARRYASQA